MEAAHTMREIATTNREMGNIYTGGNQGSVNTAEQNLTHKTVEAKLKITRMRQGIGKIKQEVTNTETRPKTYKVDRTQGAQEGYNDT